MKPTLDQQRAAYAWQCATNRRSTARYPELTKGAPALVMGSGLMAALAFWQSRTEGPGKELVGDVLGWLATRQRVPADFEKAMGFMTAQSSRQYMELTDEALALLRWLRQFANALPKVDA